jgi:hypothetical protein
VSALGQKQTLAVQNGMFAPNSGTSRHLLDYLVGGHE